MENAALLSLPIVQGRYTLQAILAPLTWMHVGGVADVLFAPYDLADLCTFLKNKPSHYPVTWLGCGSNLLVRDGGIRGVVIRLRKGFHHIHIQDTTLLEVGAGALDSTVARAAMVAGIGGLEFLATIPGSIGGALCMNAGAYKRQMQDIVVQATLVDQEGKLHTLSASALQYAYRRCRGLPAGWGFVSALLQGYTADPDAIQATIDAMLHARKESQPNKEKTLGSTFKNPVSAPAWKLIRQAGCEDWHQGAVRVSPKHANFLINTGGATAKDVEELGRRIQRKVYQATGVLLEWEVQRVGDAV